MNDKLEVQIAAYSMGFLPDNQNKEIAFCPELAVQFALKHR